MIYPSRHISVSINRSASDVYSFASNPANLPEWAAGLSGSIEKVGEDWIADSPMGKVKVKFADVNLHGVLDHEVTLPTGTKVYNPMRVFPNCEGSEVIFTLYRFPEMTDDTFSADASLVETDLRKLKSILETGR